MKFRERKKEFKRKMDFLEMDEKEKKMYLRHFSRKIGNFFGMDDYLEDRINYLYRMKKEEMEHRIKLLGIEYGFKEINYD